MTTRRKFFSGNTLEIAVMHAARHHGLQPEEVAYRKIEKRHGFLRSRKGVVIEVDPGAPCLAADEERAPIVEVTSVEVPSDEVTSDDRPIVEIPEYEPPRADSGEDESVTEDFVEPAIPEPRVTVTASARDDGFEGEEPTPELMDAARRGLREIMDFAKLDLESEVTEGEGQLEIELSGPDRARLVEDRGNLLLAIQHLLPRFIRGYTGRSIPCHVDSEDFHASREAELEKMAEEAAQEVRERQRPRTLPPMNPAERRIIHVTLADNKEVATESQGKGFFKRVTISPAMRRPRGFDRY